jgi:hypothetical protein
MTAGWKTPTRSAEESTPRKDSDGSPNFFTEYPRPVPFKSVAQLTVHTFAKVLGVPHPGFLAYHAFDDEGRSILFSSLGLKRADPR